MSQAELDMADHHDPVQHHHHRDHPVDASDKHPVEVEEEAEVGVAPHPHGEGEEHHSDDGDVGGAVQENHHVHQGELLHL